MIDPATSWFEIIQSDIATSDVVANKVEIAWLSRYPWPTKITYDHGSEFIGSEFQQLIKENMILKPNLHQKEIHNQMQFLKEYIKPLAI